MDIEDITLALGLGLLALAIIFLWCILGSLIGCIMGFIVSLTPLESLVVEGFRRFNVDVQDYLPHVGSAIGFICGLLRGIAIDVEKFTKSD